MMTEFTPINYSYCAIDENLLSDNEEKHPAEGEEMNNDISNEKIYNILNCKTNPIDEDNIKENDLYLIKKNSVKKTTNLFVLTENANYITKLIKKKRGKHSNLNKYNKKLMISFLLIIYCVK